MKKPTNILFIITFLFLYSINLMSQNINPHENVEEKIKSEKVAFITGKIGLTVKEAQDFWPLFNEQEERMNKLFEEERQLAKELNINLSILSDNDILNKSQRLIEIKIERVNLEKEYFEKYKNILTPKKLSTLYQADREFKKYLLNKYK